MRRLAILLILASPAAADELLRIPPTSTVAGLPTCDSSRDGLIRSVTDGTSSTDCSTGGGAATALCQCDGSAWGSVRDGSGHGNGNVSGCLDYDEDGTCEAISDGTYVFFDPDDDAGYEARMAATQFIFADNWYADANNLGILYGTGGLLAKTAGLTTPTLLPARGDGNSGVGSDTTDTISLIAGGANVLQVDNDGTSATTTISGLTGTQTAAALVIDADGDSTPDIQIDADGDLITKPSDVTSVVIGDGASWVSSFNTVVGAQAATVDNNNVAVGYSALAATQGVAIGRDADAQDRGVAIGYLADADGPSSGNNSAYPIAIGNLASATQDACIAVGRLATCTAAQQIVFDTTSVLYNGYTSMWLGAGVTDAAPPDFTLAITEPSADAASPDLTIQGADAFASAVTNQDGGNIVLTPGDKATGGGSDGSVIVNGTGSATAPALEFGSAGETMGWYLDSTDYGHGSITNPAALVLELPDDAGGSNTFQIHAAYGSTVIGRNGAAGALNALTFSGNQYVYASGYYSSTARPMLRSGGTASPQIGWYDDLDSGLRYGGTGTPDAWHLVAGGRDVVRVSTSAVGGVPLDASDDGTSHRVVIEGAATQATDLLTVQTSGGNDYLAISSAGLVTVGDGVASSGKVRLVKGSAGTGELQFYEAGTERAVIELDASENLVLSTGTGPTSPRLSIASTGTATFTPDGSTGALVVSTSGVDTTNSGIVRDVNTYSANQTLGVSDHIVLVDTDAVTITLPTCGGSATGREYQIKNVAGSGSTVTLDANGAETIDRSLTQTLTDLQAVTVRCDGAGGWWIF